MTDRGNDYINEEHYLNELSDSIMTEEEREYNLNSIDVMRGKVTHLLGYDFFINMENLPKNPTYKQKVSAWNKDQDIIAGMLNDANGYLHDIDLE